MQTKKCSRCGEVKDYSEFHKETRNKTGYRNICIACRSTPEELRKSKIQKSLYKSKLRAKKKGLEHNLTYVYLLSISLEYCPIEKIKMNWDQINPRKGKFDNSPTLDRIDNNKGYIEGNVMFISHLANRRKNDFSVQDILDGTWQRYTNYIRSGDDNLRFRG